MKDEDNIIDTLDELQRITIAIKSEVVADSLSLAANLQGLINAMNRLEEQEDLEFIMAATITQRWIEAAEG